MSKTPSWIEDAISKPDPYAGPAPNAAAAEAHRRRLANADFAAEAAGIDQAVADHATASSADGLAALDKLTAENEERERQRLAKLRGES